MRKVFLQPDNRHLCRPNNCPGVGHCFLRVHEGRKRYDWRVYFEAHHSSKPGVRWKYQYVSRGRGTVNCAVEAHPVHYIDHSSGIVVGEFQDDVPVVFYIDEHPEEADIVGGFRV